MCITAAASRQQGFAWQRHSPAPLRALSTSITGTVGVAARHRQRCTTLQLLCVKRDAASAAQRATSTRPTAQGAHSSA